MSFNPNAGRFIAGKSDLLMPSMGASISVVRHANITDVDAIISIMGEMRWCASSIAKSTPEMGAPVATAKPEQAPPVIEYRSHARCFLPKENTLPRPIATPICTEGPSLPSGTPIRNDMSDIENIPTRFLSHLNEIIPRRIPIEVGMPPPRRFGMRLYMYAKRNAGRSGTDRTKHSSYCGNAETATGAIIIERNNYDRFYK